MELHCINLMFMHLRFDSSPTDIGNCLLSEKREFELTAGDVVSTSDTTGDWDIYEPSPGGIGSRNTDCFATGANGFSDGDRDRNRGSTGKKQD